ARRPASAARGAAGARGLPPRRHPPRARGRARRRDGRRARDRQRVAGDALNRLAAGFFAVLVIAPFGAFFVAQRLKNAPPVLGEIGVRGVFSPNGDGRFDVTRLTFRVKETDTVSVSVLDADGDEVRELLGGTHVTKGTLVRLKWDGRDDDGTRAPDGRYRYRVPLQQGGRSVVLAKSVRLDTTPPRPEITSIGP